MVERNLAKVEATGSRPVYCSWISKNDINKMLYKQNPKAKFVRFQSNNLYYGTFIELEDKSMQEVVFEIPATDVGDGKFWRDEDAKLLIRWLC